MTVQGQYLHKTNRMLFVCWRYFCLLETSLATASQMHFCGLPSAWSDRLWEQGGCWTSAKDIAIAIYDHCTLFVLSEKISVLKFICSFAKICKNMSSLLKTPLKNTNENYDWEIHLKIQFQLYCTHPGDTWCKFRSLPTDFCLSLNLHFLLKLSPPQSDSQLLYLQQLFAHFCRRRKGVVFYIRALHLPP